MTDSSHRSTILLAADAIVKLSQLLERTPDRFMIVIPKESWREFVNRCNMDVRGMVKEAPISSPKEAPKWLQISGVYYVPGS